MAEHKHGEMDIKDHEATFNGFMSWTKWTVIAIVGIIIFMAIFAT